MVYVCMSVCLFLVWNVCVDMCVCVCVMIKVIVCMCMRVCRAFVCMCLHDCISNRLSACDSVRVSDYLTH